MNLYMYENNGQVTQSFHNGEGAPPTGNFVWDEVDYDLRLIYVQDGLIYRKPDRPDEFHEFDFTTHEWVDPRSFSELCAAKNSQINTWRALANQSTFFYLGKEIACDSLSRSDIDAVNGEVSLTGALPSNWLGAWKAKNNTYVTIPDVATWTAFYQAMTAQGTANFLHAQTLKAQVASATTIVEVDSIVW